MSIPQIFLYSYRVSCDNPGSKRRCQYRQASKYAHRSSVRELIGSLVCVCEILLAVTSLDLHLNVSPHRAITCSDVKACELMLHRSGTCRHSHAIERLHGNEIMIQGSAI